MQTLPVPPTLVLHRQGLILSVVIQLTGATLFGFIIAATRRIVQFIAPIQKATTTNLQVRANATMLSPIRYKRPKSILVVLLAGLDTFLASLTLASLRKNIASLTIQKVSEYAIDRRLPDGVCSRIKRHFRYFYFKTSVFDEKAVMQHVPWQLSQEVVATTHAVALSATGLLQARMARSTPVFLSCSYLCVFFLLLFL